MRVLRAGFNECHAGVQVNWNTPNLTRGGIVVPVIGCWWVDYPQHMQLIHAKHCGFCCCPKHALADFESDMEVRVTAASEQEVSSCEVSSKK